MKHLSNYSYTEDDDEFYDRALDNYPDHDPVKPRRGVRWAGPVNGSTPPYTQEEVNEIIKQGRDRPRPLTHDETELVRQNRRKARADLAAMEEWYRTECRDTETRHHLPMGTSSYGFYPRKSNDAILQGVELSDSFWKPVIW